MKKLLAILAISLFVFTACESETDDEKQVELTPEEARSEIGEIAADMDLEVFDLTGSKAVQTMEEFFGLFVGFESFEGGRKEKQSWLKNKLAAITAAFVENPVGRVDVENDEVSFDEIKGVWEWNAMTEEFEKADESDFFVLLFPSENSTTNNAELTITELEFITINYVDDFETSVYQEPSKIVGNVKVDGEEVISADVSIGWNESTGIPVSGNASVNMSPYSMALSFDDTQTLTSQASYSLTKNGDVIVGFEVDITFIDDEKDEASEVEGYVQYANLKIQGSVTGFEEEGIVDLNDYVNLEILINDDKVGDIIFKEDDLAYLRYEDGEEVWVEEILEDVIERIEVELDEFEDEEDFVG